MSRKHFYNVKKNGQFNRKRQTLWAINTKEDSDSLLAWQESEGERKGENERAKHGRIGRGCHVGYQTLN